MSDEDPGSKRTLLPGSLINPPSDQSYAAVNLLSELKLDFEPFQKEIRAHFEKCVISVYRRPVESALRWGGPERKHTIAKKIGLSEGQVNRLMNNIYNLSWENLFLAVAAYDVRLDAPPRGREAVIQGILATVGHIRQTVLNGSPGELHHEGLECLHYTAFNPKWWHAQEASDKDKLGELASSIIAKIRRALPGVPMQIKGYSDIAQVLAEWSEPWLLFHAVIPYKWSFFEEIHE